MYNKYRTTLIFLLLVLPLCFLWMPWYTNMIPDKEHAFTGLAKLNGWEIFLYERGRILISFLFCIILQAASFHGKKYLYPLLGQGLLLFELTTFSLINYYPFRYTGFYFLKTFCTGFYISVVSLLLNIIFNILEYKNVKRYERMYLY